MNSAAELLRQVLIEQELGSDPLLSPLEPWPIWVCFLPTQPDEAMCIYDTAGRMDGRIMATGEKIEHPGFQVFLRGPDYQVIWAKMRSVAVALDSIRRAVVTVESGPAYILHNASRTGAPISLGVEQVGDRRRVLFTLNGIVTMSEEQ